MHKCIHHVVSVSSKHNVSIIVYHIIDCHKDFLGVIISPYNERIAWIQCVYVERNLPHRIRFLNHIAVSNSGNHAPLNQFLVFLVLTDNSHSIVQFRNAFRHIVTGNRCNILNRFANKETRFE